MSYQERRAIVSLVSSVVITAIYCAYMVQRYPQVDAYATAVFHFWGSFYLILIPVSIVARIFVYVLFSILHTVATREDESSVTDERDKLIDMKATQNALYVFSAGVMLAIGSLVLDAPPAAMFILILCAGVASEMVSDISQFYLYRRGF